MSDDYQAGDVMVHTPTGATERLDRPKEDGTGWWLADRQNGLSWRALARPEWVHVPIGAAVTASDDYARPPTLKEEAAITAAIAEMQAGTAAVPWADTDRGEGTSTREGGGEKGTAKDAAPPSPHFVPAAGQPTMTTWEDASGELIFGEFDFMCDRLWIDDADVDEPIEFTRTEWVAVRRTKSWRSEDRPVCSSCHGEGETPSGAACGRCLGDGVFAEPIEQVVSDERWLVDPTRDPAASAPLSELVAMNIAGDIEAVADDMEAGANGLLWDAEAFWEPHPARAFIHTVREQYAARLRRIAAGIREAQ